MNAAPNPADPSLPGNPSISAAADRARTELHQEIERVRLGVEEMLAEQNQPIDADLRRELDSIREETRLYVKKRVRKTEKKLERSIRKVDERTGQLEQRIDQVEADRQAAECRIHNETARMLDGLLQEVRAIADLLTRQSRRGAAGGRGVPPPPLTTTRLNQQIREETARNSSVATDLLPGTEADAFQLESKQGAAEPSPSELVGRGGCPLRRLVLFCRPLARTAATVAQKS